MARFIGDDGPDMPGDHLDPETLQPVKPRPTIPATRKHPADRGVSAMDWLGTTEAARWLGVHPNTLKRWCDEGKAPPHQRIGTRGDRRFRVNELERWVQAQQAAAAFEAEAVPG
jgi:excisionase family DNA binding protein